MRTATIKVKKILDTPKLVCSDGTLFNSNDKSSAIIHEREINDISNLVQTEFCGGIVYYLYNNLDHAKVLNYYKTFGKVNYDKDNYMKSDYVFITTHTTANNNTIVDIVCFDDGIDTILSLVTRSATYFSTREGTSTC